MPIGATWRCRERRPDVQVLKRRQRRGWSFFSTATTFLLYLAICRQLPCRPLQCGLRCSRSADQGGRLRGRPAQNHTRYSAAPSGKVKARRARRGMLRGRRWWGGNMLHPIPIKSNGRLPSVGRLLTKQVADSAHATRHHGAKKKRTGVAGARKMFFLHCIRLGP